MKKALIFSSLILISWVGCSFELDNQLTIKNFADEEVSLLFKANEIKVPAGETVILKNLKPQGVYEYSTIYRLPVWATDSQAEGDMAGTMNINAGTKILLQYGSRMTDSTYLIFAIISTDENLAEETTAP